MHKLLALKIGWVLAIFAFLDILCVGLGMGVPICCILFGLPVGWYVARKVAAQPLPVEQILGQVLRWAVLTSTFTFVMMGLLWGRCIIMLFDPLADLAHFGIPFILYTPRASFVGWLALMVFIAPFLQLLMTLFASYLTLLRQLGSRGGNGAEADP